MDDDFIVPATWDEAQAAAARVLSLEALDATLARIVVELDDMGHPVFDLMNDVAKAIGWQCDADRNGYDGTPEDWAIARGGVWVTAASFLLARAIANEFEPFLARHDCYALALRPHLVN